MPQAKCICPPRTVQQAHLPLPWPVQICCCLSSFFGLGGLVLHCGSDIFLCSRVDLVVLKLTGSFQLPFSPTTTMVIPPPPPKHTQPHRPLGICCGAGGEPGGAAWGLRAPHVFVPPCRGAVHWRPEQKHVQQPAQASGLAGRLPGLPGLRGPQWPTPGPHRRRPAPDRTR